VAWLKRRGARVSEEIPFEFFSLWDEDARQWAAELYHSAPIKLVLSQFIEIHRELLHLPTVLDARD
jgi:hypothetical protein